jgi:hypothetical protein
MIKPWFLTEGKTCCYTHHIFLLEFSTGWSFCIINYTQTSSLAPFITAPSIAIKNFSGAVAGEKEDFCKGSFARTSFILF